MTEVTSGEGVGSWPAHRRRSATPGYRIEEAIRSRNCQTGCVGSKHLWREFRCFMRLPSSRRGVTGRRVRRRHEPTPTLNPEAYVWVWLPRCEEPVPAGLVRRCSDRLVFGHRRRYLARGDAVSLFERELALVDEWNEPLADLEVPGCLADAAPDAWGSGLSRTARDADIDRCGLPHTGRADRIGSARWLSGIQPTSTTPSAPIGRAFTVINRAGRARSLLVLDHVSAADHSRRATCSLRTVGRSVEESRCQQFCGS